jgi:hypothetical protein
MSNSRIHKEDSPEAVQRHLAFFSQLPEPHRPSGIVARDGACFYSYDYVEGQHPRTQAEVDIVYEVAQRVLWKPRATDPLLTHASVVAYCSYALNRANSFPADRHLLNFDGMRAVERAIQILTGTDPALFTPVAMVHGDLTMENVIITPKGMVVFIDPGHNRGCLVRELDEGKILQSTLLKWDLMNRTSGFFLVRPPGLVINRLNVAFLITHVVRLLCHPERHDENLLRCAASTLPHLGELL